MYPKRGYSRRSALLIVLAVTSFFFAATSFGSFQLKVVARPGQVIDGKTITSLPLTFVALNDRGEVAFAAAFTNPDGTPGGGLFVNDRLLVEVGQTLHGKTLTSIGVPVINNGGVLLFRAGFAGGQGIFTPSELIVETGEVIDGKTIFGFISTPIINDLGDVLYHARTGAGVPSPSALFTRSGLVAQTGVAIDGRAPVNIISGVDLNNAGDIAFIDVVPFSSPLDSALMTPDAVLLETGTVLDGVTLTNFRDLSLNENRQAVFIGGNGIFRFDIPTRAGELLFESGTAVGDEVIAIFGSPQLNDRGELSFTGLFEDRTRRGVVAAGELVIKSGDLLAGKVFSAPGAFLAQNNHGDVAFWASFTDITPAVVLATRDSDGDGIPDGEDACQSSDLSDTVVIDDCETGVMNDLFGDGCSLADIITNIVEECAAGAASHGQTVSCITHETNELKRAGILSGEDKGAIQSCLP